MGSCQTVLDVVLLVIVAYICRVTKARLVPMEGPENLESKE